MTKRHRPDARSLHGGVDIHSREHPHRIVAAADDTPVARVTGHPAMSALTGHLAESEKMRPLSRRMTRPASLKY